MQNTTIIQKLQAKKNKKGFTLVELVIVIAILAILAAIAIPVIVSTINSANTSTFTSDAATVEMLVKAAVNEAKGGVKTEYASGEVTSVNDVKVGSIAAKNGYNGAYTKKVDNDEYKMYYINQMYLITATTAPTSGAEIDINGQKITVGAGTNDIVPITASTYVQKNGTVSTSTSPTT